MAFHDSVGKSRPRPRRASFGGGKSGIEWFFKSYPQGLLPRKGLHFVREIGPFKELSNNVDGNSL